MPYRSPCRLYIHLAFTHSVGPSSVVLSKFGPAQSFPPMIVLEMEWSWALSLVCEVALSFHTLQRRPTSSPQLHIDLRRQLKVDKPITAQPSKSGLKGSHEHASRQGGIENPLSSSNHCSGRLVNCSTHTSFLLSVDNQRMRTMYLGGTRGIGQEVGGTGVFLCYIIDSRLGFRATPPSLKSHCRSHTHWKPS